MFGSSPLEIMAMQAMLQGWVYCQAFVYSAIFTGTTALGANATVNIPTQITADSDFIVQRMNLVAFSAAGTLRTDPDYTLLLTINGSGRQLMDQAQSVLNITGNFTSNKVPSDWPFPYLIQANNTITAQLANRTANAENRIDLSYVGFKVYYLEKPDGKRAERKEVFHTL